MTGAQRYAQELIEQLDALSYFNATSKVVQVQSFILDSPVPVFADAKPSSRLAPPLPYFLESVKYQIFRDANMVQIRNVPARRSSKKWHTPCRAVSPTAKLMSLVCDDARQLSLFFMEPTPVIFSQGSIEQELRQMGLAVFDGSRQFWVRSHKQRRYEILFFQQDASKVDFQYDPYIDGLPDVPGIKKGQRAATKIRLQEEEWKRRIECRELAAV